MTHPEISIYKKKDLPSLYKPALFELMRDWEEENHQLPPASSMYYKLQLDVPPEIDFNDSWALAIRGEEVVGYGKIEWKIAGSNMNRASLLLHFLPEHNLLHNYQKMIATLLDALPNHTEIIDYWGREGNLLDKHFIRIGLEASFKERISVSEIKDHFTLQNIQAVADKGKEKLAKQGYEILEIRDADFSGLNFPEFVRIYESIVNDMPLEDLTTEKMALTPEKIRNFYDTNRKIGVQFITYIAQSSGGDIAGFTQTTLNEFNPKVSEQGDTGVIAEHRGKGIGLILKYQSLQYLLEHTDVEYWMTGNAGSNEHMIRINDLLHYESWFVAHEYEIKRSVLLELLS